MRMECCVVGICSHALLMGLLWVSLPANAQIVDVYTNYEERIGSRSTPTSLGVDEAFGARTNIATGGISFSVPVLSIPGNIGMDISVIYKLSVRNFGGATQWNFEEDEPYLSGTFSESAGWTSQLGGAARCSNVAIAGGGPPTNIPSSNGRPGKFYTNEYWTGYYLSTSGGGGRLNRRLGTVAYAPDPPVGGGPYKWVTNDLWFFSCIPLASGGTGEGFVGHAPDGRKYYFDTMREGLPLVMLGKRNVQGQEIELERKDLRIYAGKIEDRFGNQITGLSASDGRNVVKTVSGSIVTYSYGGRQWVVQTAAPFSVTYPDGSMWKATINGTIVDYVSLKVTCPNSQTTASPSTTTATIQSASGATGIYTLKQVVLGYSQVSGQCFPLDEGGSTIDRADQMISPALIKRVVSGPGLATETLNIDYGPVNHCYSNSFHGAPCGPTSPMWRKVTHSYSDGRYSRYIYGNRELNDADLLLKLEEGAGSGSPLRTTEFTYTLMPKTGEFVGTRPYSIGEWRTAIMTSKKTTQDGRVFNWAVSSDCGSGSSLCVDAYGRPTKVAKTTSPSP